MSLDSFTTCTMADTVPREDFTKYGQPAIIYLIPDTPDLCYIFSIKKKDSKLENISLWKCTACAVLKGKYSSLPPAPTVKVRSGRLLEDPAHPSNAHFCVRQSTIAMEATQKHRETLQELKRNGKRPRDAYTDTPIQQTPTSKKSSLFTCSRIRLS